MQYIGESFPVLRFIVDGRKSFSVSSRARQIAAHNAQNKEDKRSKRGVIFRGRVRRDGGAFALSTLALHLHCYGRLQWVLPSSAMLAGSAQQPFLCLSLGSSMNNIDYGARVRTILIAVPSVCTNLADTYLRQALRFPGV